MNGYPVTANANLSFHAFLVYRRSVFLVTISGSTMF